MPLSNPHMQGQVVGKYRLVRLLGEGGMGVVWEAEREGLGGRVALKILRPEHAQQAEFAARFFNEAHATNAIDHPAMVKVFDHGQTPEGAAFLAMEFVAGESLASRLEKTPLLGATAVMQLGRQIASAIAAAHAKRIIHRDLKPENIMLVVDDDSMAGERVKILDFGIAKIANQSRQIVQTQGNIVMGTPPYMSPEQCAGGKGIDDKSDVYTLGVILYQMLAGRTPFVADEPGRYIGMHLFKEPPPLGSLAPEAPARLIELVHAMLEKEPGQRPTMAQVAGTLQQLGQAPSRPQSVEDGPADFTGIVITSAEHPFVETPTVLSDEPVAIPAQTHATQPSAPPPAGLVGWGERARAFGERLSPRTRLAIAGATLGSALLILVVRLGTAERVPPADAESSRRPADTRPAPQTGPGPAGAAEPPAPAGSSDPATRERSDLEFRPVGREDEETKGAEQRSSAKSKGAAAARHVAWTQEDTDRLLIQARGKSAAGNHPAAMNDAYLAAQRGNAHNAWAMAGVYACNSRNLRVVNDAVRHLDGKGGDRFWYTYLVNHCQKNGYQLTPERRLRLAP